MRYFLIGLLALLIPIAAGAFPYPSNSINLSGIIGGTGTFQAIQVKNTQRMSCVIENNSVASNSMYVYFGPLTSATTGASVKLSAGQSVSCSSYGGMVLNDQVSITGTSGDAFFANFQ